MLVYRLFSALFILHTQVRTLIGPVIFNLSKTKACGTDFWTVPMVTQWACDIETQEWKRTQSHWKASHERWRRVIIRDVTSVCQTAEQELHSTFSHYHEVINPSG